MAKEQIEYQRLPDSEIYTQDDEDPSLPSFAHQHSFPKSRYAYMAALVLLVSVCLNVMMYIEVVQQRAKLVTARNSKFAGLTNDLDVVYQSKTDYSGDNETLDDELWDSINSTSAGAVALDDEWATSRGLIRAHRFPWDKTKGLYYIQGIHDVHCLKLIYKSTSEYHHGKEQSISHSHIVHCLDALRLRAMCMAEDIPLASHLGGAHRTGQGQVQQCRDWDKLVAWANDPSRHACYASVDEYREAAHQIERFAFCQEHSPFRPAMESWFEKHGHKTLFE